MSRGGSFGRSLPVVAVGFRSSIPPSAMDASEH